MLPTILDVLDHFDGGNSVTSDRVPQMSIHEIDELCEQVNAFYEAWTPPIHEENQEQPLTVYPGGMVGGITSEGSPEVGHLFAALMYYPRAVIHDPLSSWFNRDKERLTLKSGPKLRADEIWTTSTEYATGMQGYMVSRQDMNSARDSLRNMLRIIEVLRPLIKQGTVLPVPQWKIVRRREQEIATAMRHDLRDEELWSLISDTSGPTPRVFSVSDLGLMVGGFSGSNLPKGSERLNQVEAPSFYLNKMITIADEMHAVYVPPFEADYSLFRTRIDRIPKELRMRSPLERKIIHDLSRLDLPAFDGLTAENLVRARQNEDAFEDFRVVLDREFRSAYSVTEDAELFPDQALDAVRAALSAEIREVERAASGRLLSGLREGRKSLVLGGVGGGVALGLAPVPMPMAVGVGVAAAGISAAVYNMIFRPKLSGSKLVISALVDR